MGNIQKKLPLEYPLAQALRIYVARLRIFLGIVLINLIVLLLLILLKLA